MYTVKVVFEKGPLKNVQQCFTDIQIRLMHVGFIVHSQDLCS